MIISKTKPSSIIKNLESRDYARGPTKEIMMLTKNDCQALIISRFGILECGASFKRTMNDRRVTCDQVDDEEHRLNYCEKFSDISYTLFCISYSAFILVKFNK